VLKAIRDAIGIAEAQRSVPERIRELGGPPSHQQACFRLGKQGKGKREKAQYQLIFGILVKRDRIERQSL
jgi:hypothetical protein